jgi:hypothetical protein
LSKLSNEKKTSSIKVIIAQTWHWEGSALFLQNQLLRNVKKNLFVIFLPFPRKINGIKCPLSHFTANSFCEKMEFRFFSKLSFKRGLQNSTDVSDTKEFTTNKRGYLNSYVLDSVI